MKTIKQYPITFYLILVVMLSLFPFSLMFQSGDSEDDLGTFILMWMPALAAIIHRAIIKQPILKGAGWNPFKSIKWLTLAMLIPILLSITAIAMQTTLGFIDYNYDFISINNGMVKIKGIAMLLGAAEQPLLMFIANFLLSFFVGNIFYMLVFALGEEFGWRAHLQSLLTNRYSENKAFVILGIIWGLWHFPGVYLGHNFPDYPIFGGLVLMPITCIAFSFAFGIAYKKSQSIWVPVMFHSAINLSSGMDTKMIAAKTNVIGIDAIWLGLWILVAIVIYVISKFNTNSLERGEVLNR